MFLSVQEVTGLLLAWGQGDPGALDRLIPVVHQELRRIARRHMAGERSGQTLQTTALVNEAYLRLIGSQKVRWQDRAHFFAVFAQLMRRILVDYARSRNYQKRGAGAHPVSLIDNLDTSPQKATDLVALDEALEIAEVLKVSPQTVLRDWKLSKVWLLREMPKGRMR